MQVSAAEPDENASPIGKLKSKLAVVAVLEEGNCLLEFVARRVAASSIFVALYHKSSDGCTFKATPGAGCSKVVAREIGTTTAPVVGSFFRYPCGWTESVA